MDSRVTFARPGAVHRGKYIHDEKDRQDIRKFLEGDPKAVDGLWQRNWEFAVQMAKRWVEDKDVAEDLAQEAFRRVLGWAQQNRTTERFRSFLETVIRNLAFDHRKRGWVRTSVDLSWANDIPVRESIEEIQEAVGFAERVDDALQKLPEKHRKALELHMEGLSNREAAGVMMIKEGALRMHLFRARKDMAQILEPCLGMETRKKLAHYLS